MTTYRFTSDPGHGWLHVKRDELKRLGIADRITTYSYQKGGMVYLEEDYDASLFIDAKKMQGEAVDFKVKHVDYTPIRYYHSYKKP